MVNMLTKPPKAPAISSGDPLDLSRFNKRAISEAFERIGGVDRLADEADKDPKWFLEKIWTKTIQPEKIEVARERTIAEMLEELEKQGQIVNVTPSVALEEKHEIQQFAERPDEE